MLTLPHILRDNVSLFDKLVSHIYRIRGKTITLDIFIDNCHPCNTTLRTCITYTSFVYHDRSCLSFISLTTISKAIIVTIVNSHVLFGRTLSKPMLCRFSIVVVVFNNEVLIVEFCRSASICF